MAIRLVDEDTGEVVGMFHQGDRIIRKKTLEYLADKGIAIPKDAAFIKMFKDALPQLSSCGMSVAESKVFFYLLENIRYGSNVAKYDNGTLITRDDICNDTKNNIGNVQRAIVRLCQRGLIAIAKIDIGKVFIVNPFVAMRGSQIDKTTYDLFKKTKWARDWNRAKS